MIFFKRSKTYASVKHPSFAGWENENGRLWLVRGSDFTGEKAYYFVLLHEDRIQHFKLALASGRGFELQDYGCVVASGYGERVPETLRIRMRVEFGNA